MGGTCGWAVEDCGCGFFGDGITHGELEVCVFRGLDLACQGLRAVGVDGADHQFADAGVRGCAVEEYWDRVVDGYVVVGDLSFVRDSSR